MQLEWVPFSKAKKYGYDAVDICYLLDHPDHEEPTRANIIKYILSMVRDARPRDRFFFHFSGHSSQEDTTDINESDGMNEYILTCLNEKILDNELNTLLVKSLPPGSSLTSVFDSCHSGTLLDLDHYLCNGIYLPYVNKGHRKTKDLWRRQGRRGAFLHESGATAASTLNRQSGSRLNNANASGTSQTTSGPALRTQSAVTRASELTKGTGSFSIRTDLLKGNSTQFLDNSRLHDSPQQIYQYCDGFTCQKSQHGSAHVNVISISSSADSQRTWEDENGMSMTMALVNMLSDDPHPPLNQVLTMISFQLHASCLTLHAKAVKFRKRLRRFNEKKLRRGSDPVEEPEILPEMVNFQVPQISSVIPLPPDKVWDP
ncbi:hypothetical protein NLJ89_g2450 [Agrocybe chaxingu]|uniref:Peptidase C14 caspase domain-containing protein n=1 Tax=Agrocybe chaxingu TaxID=84603 RepID=A0A9W8K7H4_9AGAR|nr:hypothetical protein NLJ89_g2450 [Agrocybe chaxingu]